MYLFCIINRSDGRTRAHVRLYPRLPAYITFEIVTICFFFSTYCQGKAIWPITKPRQRKNGENGEGQLERETRSSLLTLDLKDDKL